MLEFDVDAMATCPDQFPRLAVKRAQSPEIARLFEDLARRAEVFAKMLDEFTESVGRHRSAREGRPVRLSRRQQQMLSEFDRDAEKAVQEMERHIARLDDATLLSSALSGVDQQIRLDERMFTGWHEDDKPMAARLLDFERETKAIIQRFVESSPFKGKVRSLWNAKQTTKRAG